MESDQLLVRYEKWERISSGSSGVIYRIFDMVTKQHMVAKVEKPSVDSRFTVKGEYERLKQLSHPNIVTVYNYIDIFKCMVMEYAQYGDLLTFTNEEPVLPELIIKNIYHQIITALVYIHNFGFIHGDIKLENILIFEIADGPLVKLADFGFCAAYHTEQMQDYKLGSLGYCAPEIILDFDIVGPELDIWSSGIVLYCMAYRTFPIGLNIKGKISETIEYLNKLRVTPLVLPEVPPRHAHLKTLLQKILVVAPKARISGPEILLSEWFDKENKLIPQLDLSKISLEHEPQTDSSERSPLDSCSTETTPSKK